MTSHLVSATPEQPPAAENRDSAVTRSTISESESPTRLHPREPSSRRRFAREDDIRCCEQMEEGYRQITLCLFEPLPLVRELVEVCRAVEEGSRALDQVARVESECLSDKKALWRERQKFIRRVKHIDREASALEDLLGRTADGMPTKRIWRRKVKLGRRVQQLSLRHYLIDSFLKKFNQAAEETIALNRRIAELVRNGATPKGEETGPAEVEKFRRDLKEHERFLGRKATHVVGAVTQIAKWKDCIIAARNRMVEGHLGLVAPIASRYANRGVELSDLLAEGNLGLVKAVEEFDYRRGLKFSAHAAYWIRKTIARAVADQTLSPRLPAHVVNAVEKVAEVRREFVQTQGREPSVGEIAERLSTAKETIQALISISQPDVSLDRLDGEGEPSLPGDFIRDAEASPLSRAVRDSILGEKLELALKVLTKREERVLRLRFGLGDGYPRTLEEVGQIFNISRERVRQIEAAALDKLRRPLSLRELKVLQELL